MVGKWVGELHLTIVIEFIAKPFFNLVIRRNDAVKLRDSDLESNLYVHVVLQLMRLHYKGD